MYKSPNEFEVLSDKSLIEEAESVRRSQLERTQLYDLIEELGWRMAEYKNAIDRF